MALFVAKRLNKLTTKLSTIDNVLPSDDFSQSLNSRQKRFIDLLFVPEFTLATRRMRNASSSTRQNQVSGKDESLAPFMT